MSVPVGALTFLGILITVLGLLAAGSVQLVVVGLVAVAVAGVPQVMETRRR